MPTSNDTKPTGEGADIVRLFPDRRPTDNCPGCERAASGMNRLQSFEAFVTAVNVGSISGAAERLGTTKSNVSRRIAELEERLGTRLLNRSPRRLSTTDAGAEFYDRLHGHLDGLRCAEEFVIDRGTAPRGVLRVASPMSFATTYLKDVVGTLMTRYPELSVELDCDDRLTDLQKGDHDCAIRFGRLEDSSLVARRITANRHMICGSPDYFERRGVPVAPEDLRDHDGLHYSHREPHSMWQLEAAEGRRSYRVGTRMRSNNGEVLLAGAIAGLGIAILPTFLAAPALADGRLTAVLPDFVPPAGDLSVVFVRDRQPSVKLRALIDAMLAAYSPTPPWELGLSAVAQLAPPTLVAVAGAA